MKISYEAKKGNQSLLDYVEPTKQNDNNVE